MINRGSGNQNLICVNYLGWNEIKITGVGQRKKKGGSEQMKENSRRKRSDEREKYINERWRVSNDKAIYTARDR